MPRGLSPLSVVSVVLLSGCGTCVNITCPPPKMAGPSFVCENECVPFGGTVRSGLGGAIGITAGPIELLDVGKGGLLQAARLTAFGAGCIIDTPLSFVGDIVTMPIALARWQGLPWATWWGDQGWDGPRPHAPRDPVPITNDETSPSAPDASANWRASANPSADVR